MFWYTMRKVVSAARVDASLGVRSATEHVTRLLGPRPEMRIADNHEHGAMVRRANRSVEIGEWQEDLDRGERESEQHANPHGQTLALACCLAFEIFGGALTMGSLGAPQNQRLPLGVLVALSLIGFTALTSNRSSGVVGVPPRRTGATVVILLGYTAFVVALAVVRLHGSADQDGGWAALPETIVMLVCTMCPAWLAEHYLRQRRASVRVHSEVHRLRRRIRSADRDRGRGDSFLTKASRRQARWDDEAARLTAAYEAEHRRALAERGSPPSSNPKPRR